MAIPEEGRVTMRRGDTRLGQLYGGLTAQERAVLVMRSWRDGTAEHMGIRFTMPGDQVHDFNRLIRLMNGVARRLLLYIAILSERVGRVGLLVAWLSTLGLWQHTAMRTAEFIQFRTKEPVTESEYEECKRQAHERFMPVSEAAELMLEYSSWPDDDLEEQEGEQYVKMASWKREKPAKLKELARLVRAGVVQGKGRGAKLEVQAGSFYDWLGEPVPVHPERGLEFEVFPDDEAPKVRARREERDDAIEAYRLAPNRFVFHVPELSEVMDALAPRLPAGEIDEAVGGLKERLREELDEEWRRLRTVEVVLDDVSRQFGGEDLLPERVRAMLDHAREQLDAHYQDAERFLGPLEKREPAEGDVAWLRELVWGAE